MQAGQGFEVGLPEGLVGTATGVSAGAILGLWEGLVGAETGASVGAFVGLRVEHHPWSMHTSVGSGGFSGFLFFNTTLAVF